jgi:hypothetical protein
MTSFPGSPRLFKGAIVGFDLVNLIPRVISFNTTLEKLNLFESPGCK